MNLAEKMKGSEIIGTMEQNIVKHLNDLGIKPGDSIWMIRSACFDCPEGEDHCSIDCEIKDKKYLEKTTVSDVEVKIGSGGLELLIADEYGYYHDEFDKIFFDRKDALESM